MEGLITHPTQTWSPGMIARFSQTERGGSLTVITEVIGTEVRGLLVWPEEQRQADYLVPQAFLVPVTGPLTAEEWVHVQELNRAYGRSCERLREQVGQAEERITAIRRYAIEAQRNGEICRQGLDEFLEAHDLPPYRPRYRVHFTCSFDVIVTDADGRDEAEDHVQDFVRYELDLDRCGIATQGEPSVRVEEVEELDE